MADVPPLFLTAEWTTSYRRKASTPEGAKLCANRDFWLEGAMIFPVEKRQSNVIEKMLAHRKVLSEKDKYFGWNYKTCSYSEAELENIVRELKKIEKKAAHEYELAAKHG